MRIALLAAFHIHDHGWSIPISFQNELELLGHQVDRFNLYMLDQNGAGIGYTDEGLKDFLLKQHDYQLLLHCDYGMFSSPLFSQIKIKTLLEAGDDPQSFERNFQKAQYFDYVFTPDKRCCSEYQRAGIRAKWLTHFFDPLIHKDFPNIYRDKFIVTSIEEGRQGGVVRYLRDKLSIIDNNIWLDDRFFYNVDHAKFMCRGHIVFQASQYGEITRRIFEAAACKRMILTDEISADTGIYDIFPKNNAAIYYNGWHDAYEKILYYRNNLNEVEKIAQHGYEIAKNGHSVKHRVEALLDFIES